MADEHGLAGSGYAGGGAYVECLCGWRSPICGTFRDAHQALAEHLPDLGEWQERTPSND